jgi:hypothetical protein
VDGDTIKVGDMPVRLYGVDAPEGRQTHHSRSAVRSSVLVEAAASLVQRGLGRGVLGGRCLPVSLRVHSVTWALAQGTQQVVTDAPVDRPPVVIEGVRADGLGCLTLLGFDLRCRLDRSSRARN